MPKRKQEPDQNTESLRNRQRAANARHRSGLQAGGITPAKSRRAAMAATPRTRESLRSRRAQAASRTGQPPGSRRTEASSRTIRPNRKRGRAS